MGQTIYRDDDTDTWQYGLGRGTNGNVQYSVDGNLVAEASSCYGTINTNALTVKNTSVLANGDIVCILQMMVGTPGGYEFNRVVSGGGTANIVLAKKLKYTYADDDADNNAQVVKAYEVLNMTVDAGITMTVPAWDGDIGGVAFYLGKKKLLNLGILDFKGGNANVSSATLVSPTNKGGFRGGAGVHNYSGTASSYCGEGTGGRSKVTTAANGNSGGGAIAHLTAYGSASGGSGGYLGNGENGYWQENGSVGLGGALINGNGELTKLFFGGAGGGGADADTGGTLACSGANGGAIAIFIFDEIDTETGYIYIDGGNAETSDRNSTGGAASGGSGLLKARIAKLGTLHVTAKAGRRAYRSSDAGSQSTAGILHLDYGEQYTGTTDPTLSARQDDMFTKAKLQAQQGGMI